MAIVFTNNFIYKGIDYLATVSQMEGSLNITFPPNPALLAIIPEGRVVYNCHDGIEINSDGITPFQDLMIVVLAAIGQIGFTTQQSMHVEDANADSHEFE